MKFLQGQEGDDLSPTQDGRIKSIVMCAREDTTNKAFCNKLKPWEYKWTILHRMDKIDVICHLFVEKCHWVIFTHNKDWEKEGSTNIWRKKPINEPIKTKVQGEGKGDHSPMIQLPNRMRGTRGLEKGSIYCWFQWYFGSILLLILPSHQLSH